MKLFVYNLIFENLSFLYKTSHNRTSHCDFKFILGGKYIVEESIQVIE